jgi:hypothetical protein
MPKETGNSRLTPARSGDRPAADRTAARAAVERARARLRDVIELAGLSRRAVEKLLVDQGAGTDLGRMLSGRLDLKLRHVVDICGVIGLHPLEFFRMVFREPRQRSPLLQRLEALVAPARLAQAVHPATTLPEEKQIDQLRQRLRDLARDIERLVATVQASAVAPPDAAESRRPGTRVLR